MIVSNETEEYQTFEIVDQRKLRDVTKKVDAVIRHVETDDVTQSSPLDCKRSWSEERQKRRETRSTTAVDPRHLKVNEQDISLTKNDCIIINIKMISSIHIFFLTAQNVKWFG